jgi:hypothetical protein
MLPELKLSVETSRKSCFIWLVLPGLQISVKSSRTLRFILLVLPDLKFTFLPSRTLYEAAFSNTPEIAYLTEAVSHVSDIQAQNSFLLKALINENKIKVSKDHEEDEGRINTDLLSRLIIVGAPLIQPGPSMQDQLVRQVYFTLFTPFCPLAIQSRRRFIKTVLKIVHSS